MMIPRTQPHLGTLVLLTALTVLSLNMFLPALPAMRDAFGVSEAVMGVAISGYMICAAALQLIMGPLSDRIGRRPVILGFLTLYVLASIVCMLAQNIWVFLGARMLQAVAVGGGVLASAVVRDLFEGRQAAAKLGTIASAMAIAPMLAPMLGGAVDTAFGWRAVFVIYAAFGLMLLALALWDLGETRRSATRPEIRDYLDLLREPLFWAYTLCMAFAVGTFYIFLTGAPFVAAAVFGLSSRDIGIGLGSITMGFMCGSAISTRLVMRLGPLPLIIVGRSVAVAGLICGLVGFSFGAASVALFFAASICVGLGNGFTMPNANAGALSVRPELAGTAAGVSGAVMLLIGALLTGVATAFLSTEATPLKLLSLMFAAVCVSCVFVFFARGLERR
ncbi:multidrug effflux MFS transporter [Primorskyibacter sp. S187A]|uniref:multidrug effflux MFS transporter n=1 Tax=Primorskyibacter sp. S187A TaxID=3415130 RepID=UPI003C7CA3CB